MHVRHAPKEPHETDRLPLLAAEPWMLDLLALNPAYLSWGPYEDYMIAKGQWSGPVVAENWADRRIGLDDLNEVVNFYFYVERDSHRCLDCDGENYNPATKEIADAFYDHCGDGSRRWCDAITQDEADALWESRSLQMNFKEKPTAEEVNAWQRHGRGLGHDAINRWILIETRAKRLGVWGHCPECDGGEVFDADKARLGLVLWVLHPRKGASRGWDVRRIEREEVPAVLAFLAEAAERNAARFAAAKAAAGKA